MSHRTDWRVLATHDPIPGNAPEIKDAASDYGRIRQAIADAQEALEIVLTRDFTEAMVSEAVDEVKDSAETVIGCLDDVAGRYDIAAVALEEYAEQLAEAQRAADEAEEEAQHAQAVLDEAEENKSNAVRRRNLAQKAVDEYQGDPSSESDLKKGRQKRSNAQNDIWDAEADIQVAETRISTARTKLNQAITKRDDAARTAAQMIKNQINNDGQNDSRWDNTGGKVVDALASAAEDLMNIQFDLGKAIIETFKDLLQGRLMMEEGLFTMARAFFQGDWDAFTEMFSDGIEQYLEGLSLFSEKLSLICGTLALVCTFVPGGQVAAGILFGLSVIADVAYIGSEGILALKEGVLDGDWDRMKNLGVDAAIIGVATMTGPIGKGIRAIAKPVIREGVSVVGTFAKGFKDDVGRIFKDPGSLFNPARAGVENFVDYGIRQAKPVIDYFSDNPCQFTVPSVDIDFSFPRLW